MTLPLTLIETLRRANSVAVLTGAGISAESGLPTFREAQTGLWAKYEPTELATPQAFERNPQLVWDWYAWRRELVTQSKPNAGHYALAAMERHLHATGKTFTLITQNVDGFHHLVGHQTVLELHGNIQRTKCYRENTVIPTWPSTEERPPRCPRCGGYLRPDVVWFGEALPPATLTAALQAAQVCEVFFSIGTSGLVEPAASLPRLALDAKACVVEINPTPTPLTPQATYAIAGASGTVLPELVQAVWP